MDLATIIGLVLAVAMVLGAITIEGTPLEPFFPWSHSGMPAWMLGRRRHDRGHHGHGAAERLIGLPKAMLRAMMPGKHETASDLAALFVRLSEKARREGLLSLEEEEATLHNEFMKKGIMLVVDGQDPDLIRQVLEIEVKQMEARHEVAAGDADPGRRLRADLRHHRHGLVADRRAGQPRPERRAGGAGDEHLGRVRGDVPRPGDARTWCSCRWSRS